MLTHRLIEQIMWQPWRRQLNTWRTQMGLRPAPFWGLADRLHTPAAGVMVGVSPSVLPRPADWPAGHAVTGYWFQDVDPGWTPPLDLARFIEAGRVVSIGFGSPGVLQARRTLDLVMRALVLADLRAVVALPRELAGLNLPERVLPVEAVPHHWLFPRVRAAVHHGGAGTTGYSLRAGTPTVILPLAIDQFFWGERVAALKVGPRPMPQRTLTAGALAAALCQAVEDAALRGRAQALGAAIRAEDGVGRALDFIRARL